MKTAKEILARSVILLCVSDRCAMEKIYWHPPLSTQQREQQRLAIWEWLNEKGYTDYITEKEKDFFLSKLWRGFSSPYVQNFQWQYEAIEPLLWTLGIVEKRSGYNRYVVTDFRPMLQIKQDSEDSSVFVNSTHIMEEVLDKCELRSEDEIRLYHKVAMLWCWRATQGKKPIFRKKSAKEIIIEIFGKEYEKPANIILRKSGEDNDFVVNNKSVSKLSYNEVARLCLIAKWRYHALEWMMVDKEWDKVKFKMTYLQFKS